MYEIEVRENGNLLHRITVQLGSNKLHGIVMTSFPHYGKFELVCKNCSPIQGQNLITEREWAYKLLEGVR